MDAVITLRIPLDDATPPEVQRRHADKLADKLTEAIADGWEALIQSVTVEPSQEV